MSKVQLTQANSVHIPLANDSIHCCIASPPFFGLRVYEGVEPSVWGGNAGCQHMWDKTTIPPQHGDDGITGSTLGGGKTTQTQSQRQATTSAFCQLCGAWRGCLGNEPDVDSYVSHLVQVFREVKRVLHPSGVVWINLGFSYAGSWGNYAPGGIKSKQRPQTKEGKRWERKAYGDTGFLPSTANAHGYKPKDLIPIPWLVAIALQRDGWWLRSAPTWVKKNSLPESATDRPTTSHEQWLMLTKNAKYYYDGGAVRMPSTGQNGQAVNFVRMTKDHLTPNQTAIQHREDRQPTTDTGSRNRRTSDFFFESLDQLITDQCRYLQHLRHIRDNGGMLLDEDGNPLGLVFNTRGYKEAHFATFPPSMIRPLVECSTSERGVCPECGAPWGRVVKKSTHFEGGSGKAGRTAAEVNASGKWAGMQYGENIKLGPVVDIQTIGWRPACACYDDLYHQTFPQARRARKRHQRAITGNWWKRVRARPGDPNWPTAPATVLDPFIGSGTTCLVARSLGRNSIGLDASHVYLRDHCRSRLELDRLEAWCEQRASVPDGETFDELPLFRGME